MTLAEQQSQITKLLAQCRDPAERLAWLIEKARKRPMMDVGQRIDANRVEGCLARLWLVAEFINGHCQFQAESDSLLIKAVSGLICDFYSGHAPEEIVGHPPEFIRDLGLTQYITTSRSNGLTRLWEKIRDFAAAHVPASE